MKAVIYARYSSSTQTEQSIEGQMRECTEYANAHDITIVDTYIDRAISGTTDNRESFQKMIKDSDRKLFDAVIVYKIDRFTRNRYDSAIYKARLKKNGVKVLYAKESIPDGPEGIILESLLEGMAEYYSAELAQKIRRGTRESALKCHVLGGRPALGYKTAPDKTFMINEETAPIVQKIFALYDSGATVTEICKIMNEQGFKTSKGSRFNKNSLWVMLKNEKYIGVYEATGIRIDGGIPPIIEKDLFDRVQKRLAKNKKAPAKQKAKVNYILSGKLYCGCCGAGMVGESGTGRHGGKHYYYICVNKKRHKTCKKKTVRKEWLENMVVDETIKHILHPDKISTIAKRCVEINAREASENAELHLLKKQLSETQKSLDNLMNAIEQGIVTRKTKSRLEELEEIEERLKFEISVCRVKQPKLTEKHIMFMLSQFQPDSDTPREEYNSNIIECFVNSVHLFDEKLIVTYNLTNEDKELESSVLESISEYTNSNCTGLGGSDLTQSSPFFSRY
ncbi:MAG: recombinase family protein [Anaerotignum propionicum]|nr:recombinase family protein [Anaerotignum propionicum]MEA5057734.1 recombinase family protein [Anaerotignum propionicum]